MRKIIIAIFALAAVMLIFSCANRGAGPQGGPKDVDPPQVVKYSPADGCTQMKRKRIEITFDEIVVLQNAAQKVVVSPPQRTPADIKAVSHKIIVEFADSLKDSTTYSIDFTDAIADNNEGNKLNGFTYCFSTGDRLDSLEIGGRVLNAENLNPSVGIIVGVHSDNSDSAFSKIPFSRIAKTNEQGEFVIRNLPKGSYSLFALSDIGGNFIKDIPGEEIAFLDSAFVPERIVVVHRDTVYDKSDSSLIDTVIVHRKVTTSPDDVLLMSFVELDDRRFFEKALRPERHRLLTLFKGEGGDIPTLTPVNFPDSLFTHVVTFNEKRDSVSFWLKDTALWKQDTLTCVLSYTRRDIDSIYLSTDTVSYIFRYNKSAKANKAKSVNKSLASRAANKEKEKKKTLPKLAASNASQRFDVNVPLIVTFAMPTEILPHDTVGYHLQIKEDTLWKDVNDVFLEKADEGGTKYVMKHDWKPTASYRLLIDSALLLNMIGQSNGTENLDFTVKSLEEYSKLILHLTEVTGREVVQLLDGKDQVVRQIAISDTTGKKKHDITFEYIAPGVYYLRLFRDDNGDGVWTPGLYSEHRQPEEVIYFPYDIELRAFWDVEEDWNPQTTRLSKPKELIPKPEKK